MQRWRFSPLTPLTYLFSAVCLSASAWTSEPLACTHVHSGERLHTKLFVAGLAPWEPILHLSILHSWGSDFTPNFTRGDPFFLGSITGPIITHTVCFNSLLSLLADVHACAPSHTQGQSLWLPHAHVCNNTKIDTSEKQQTKWCKTLGVTLKCGAVLEVELRFRSMLWYRWYVGMGRNSPRGLGKMN